jgi:hypothetical protein
MALIIKLRATGKKLTPFIASQPKNGKQQKWFAANIGKPVGACVRSSVKKGMSIGEIHDAVRNCAKTRGKAAK